MASHDQFHLYSNRPEGLRALRFADSIETDEAFYQRGQRYHQTNKDNALLNAKSKEVREELAERRWAQMYLLHLVNRVTQTDRVRIQFSDLPLIASLSIHDSKPSFSISLSQTPRYEASVEQHAEVLELRKRDAQIGMETCWVALRWYSPRLKRCTHCSHLWLWAGQTMHAHAL